MAKAKLTFLDRLDKCQDETDVLQDDLKKYRTSGEGQITFPQRLACTKLILYMVLQIEEARREYNEPTNLGAAVRKYSAAFAQSHGAGGGAAHARRSDPDEPSIDHGFDS